MSLATLLFKFFLSIYLSRFSFYLHRSYRCHSVPFLLTYFFIHLNGYRLVSTAWCWLRGWGHVGLKTANGYSYVYIPRLPQPNKSATVTKSQKPKKCLRGHQSPCHHYTTMQERKKDKLSTVWFLALPTNQDFSYLNTAMIGQLQPTNQHQELLTSL